MRISRKLLSDHRKVLAKRVVARAVQAVETLESRVLLAGQATTVNFFALPNPATAGQNVTLEAAVSGVTSGSPNDGTVDFKNDTTGTDIGTAPVVGGTAQLTNVTTLPVGVNSIEADFTPGDPGFLANNSTPSDVTITPANPGNTPSTTMIASSTGGTSNVGDSVTFTATVTAGATGTVDFSSNGSAIGSGAINPATNQASVTTTTLAAGSDAIIASYEGDKTYASSQGNLTQTVNTASGTTATTTTLGTSNATITAGQSVTFTATVAQAGGGAAQPFNGTMDFTSGGSDLSGPVAVNSSTGVATFTTSSLGVGTYNVVATYSGDSNYAASTSNPPITETVTSVPLTSTTTTLTTSAPTVSAGTPVTFTATVAPGAAPGFVDFYEGTTDLSGGPVAVVGGVATFTTSTLAPGSHNIFAVYTPSGSVYAGSTSSTLTETINPAAGTTATTLNVSSLNPGVGSALTLTATILPASVGGTVTFFDGATPLGAPVNVSGGAASLSIASLTLGNHTLTATYNGETGESASTSPPVTVTVVQGTPVLTATTSAATITYGNTVTFTATVGPAAVGGIVPTGTVTFLDGTNPLSGAVNLVNGVATFATNTLTGGSHSISFTYSGDANYASGTSNIITQTVKTAATTVKLTAVPSPGVYLQSVTLTATVTPGAATGTINFFNGTTNLSGPVAIVGGVATFTTTTLPTGSDKLTAAYSGDTNYSPSTSPIVTETISQATSSITLSSSDATPLFGETVTFNAIVPNVGATGSVSFYNGSTLLGTSTLTAGAATLDVTTLPVGTDNVTAVYSGDTNYSSSTSAAVVETVSLAPTTTTLSAAPTTLAQGAPVDITVTVAPVTAGSATPTGTVDIYEDGTTLLQSAVPLINGTAILSSTSIVLGTSTLTAVYSGDTSYAPSTSAGTSVTVTVPTSSTSATTITASASSITYGSAVTFTATVASAIAGGVTPTGTVQFFYNGSLSLGTPTTLVGGVATLTTSSLPPGTDNVVVVYSGDTTYTPSQSGEATEIVAPTAGTYVTSLSASDTNAAFGHKVIFTATVTPANIGTPPAMSGTVTFFVGNQTIGAADVNSDGTAIFATPLPAGTTIVTATYQSGGPVNTMSLPVTVVISSPITPSLAKAIVPSSVLSGMPFHATLPIVVTNLSDLTLKGNFTLDVYLDTSPTLDSNKMLLTSLPKTFSLGSGKSKTVRLVEQIGGEQPGTYYLVADVTDPNGLTNLTASRPIAVAAPYISPVVTVGAVNPANIAIGGTGGITVIVTNHGNETASGLLDLTLSPADGNGTPIPGITLAALSPSPMVTLQPGASRKFHLVFSAASMTAGTYLPSVTVSLAGVSSTTVGTTPFVIGDLHNQIPPSPFPT